MPQQLQSELRAGMETAGIPVPESDERWQQALTALKVVPLHCWIRQCCQLHGFPLCCTCTSTAIMRLLIMGPHLWDCECSCRQPL